MSSHVREYQERRIELAGWPVRICSYRCKDIWYCSVDNVRPGARLARSLGSTRAEAEDNAIKGARPMLEKTRIRPVA